MGGFCYSYFYMKPILFIDFDGTLCHDRFWKNLDARDLNKLQKFLFTKDSQLLKEWMRGRLSSERIVEICSKDLSIPYDYLWRIFVEECKTMKVPKESLDRISSLRLSFYTVLITDNMDSFSRFTAPSLNLNRYFDIIANSADSGILKLDNDGFIFKTISAKLQSPLSVSILFDDSLKTCELFATLGGKSNLVTKSKDLLFYLKSL